MIFNKVIFFLGMIFVANIGQVRAVTRTDIKVFDAWISGKGGLLQHVFDDINFESLKDRNSSIVQKAMLTRYAKLKNKLYDLDFYFDSYLGGKEFAPNILPFYNLSQNLHSLMQNDIQGLLKHFIDAGFASLVVDRKESGDDDLDYALDRYIALMRLFCSDRLLFKERQHLFTLANNFFEYCFYPKTFQSFKKFLTYRRYHPIARLLYSTMWNNLAGEGWKEWHRSCLNNLKAAADAKKTIVYIAGGCDIYQLIRNGIYNIHIIDPMLPTQPAYYSDHWDWFIKDCPGGKQSKKGDRLVFSFDDGKTYMERTGHKVRGFFKFVDNDGVQHRLPKSITVWSVYSDGNHVGKVTFERRYCNQKDFNPAPDKQHLMSFNELYYITCTDEDDHWGIFPSKLKKDLSLCVKQLRSPLTKRVIQNMERADKSSFEFIRLGTCAVTEDEDED